MDEHNSIPSAMPEVEREILREIRQGKISVEQAANIRELAQQYQVSNFVLRELLRSYGAAGPTDLRTTAYRGLIGDLMRFAVTLAARRRRENSNRP